MSTDWTTMLREEIVPAAPATVTAPGREFTVLSMCDLGVPVVPATDCTPGCVCALVAVTHHDGVSYYVPDPGASYTELHYISEWARTSGPFVTVTNEAARTTVWSGLDPSIRPTEIRVTLTDGTTLHGGTLAGVLHEHFDQAIELEFSTTEPGIVARLYLPATPDHAQANAHIASIAVNGHELTTREVEYMRTVDSVLYRSVDHTHSLKLIAKDPSMVERNIQDRVDKLLEARAARVALAGGVAALADPSIGMQL